MTTRPSAQQAPQPLTVPEPLEALAALGAPATLPTHLDDADAVLHLSHGLVGTAERKAMEAELAVRANGADSPEILPAIEEAYAAANAQSRLDVLAHLQWRATRLVQALHALLASGNDRWPIPCDSTAPELGNAIYDGHGSDTPGRCPHPALPVPDEPDHQRPRPLDRESLGNTGYGYSRAYCRRRSR
jgi:hypothetical protein